MSQYNAFITVLGKGTATVTFYNRKHVAVDQEKIKIVKSGQYVFSVAMHLLYKVEQTERYSFSVANNGFLSVEVKWAGIKQDVTVGSNTIAFDFLNGTPSHQPASAPPQLTAGNLVLIQQSYIREKSRSLLPIVYTVLSLKLPLKFYTSLNYKLVEPSVNSNVAFLSFDVGSQSFVSFEFGGALYCVFQKFCRWVTKSQITERATFSNEVWIGWCRVNSVSNREKKEDFT